MPRITYKQLEAIRLGWLNENAPYKLCEWTTFDFKILNKIMYRKKRGFSKSGTFNDCYIMGDTETSRPRSYEKYYTLDDNGNKVEHIIPKENHVVAWTISIRAFNRNIVTLYGRKPSDMVTCIYNITTHLQGDDTYIYFHNLSYDWTFLRLFFFQKFGHPDNQLNTKPHYPLFVTFKSIGLILKDSYMLFQKGLAKTAEEYGVEHQKAVGKWDYNKYRTQNDPDPFTEDELQYIEQDTLSGVECLNAICDILGKTVFSIPYTGTGIVRAEVLQRAKEHNGHEMFLRQAPTYEQYLKLKRVYAGGFTHANRFLIDTLIEAMDEDSLIRCKDFNSSYPYCLISEMYPNGKFMPYHDCDPEEILKSSHRYAFMFKLTMLNFELKDPLNPMPFLQYYKIDADINIGLNNLDNGRVTGGGFCSIYINEIDLSIILQQYKAERMLCTEVEVTSKAYLPKWFTDYVFERYEIKCKLSDGDKALKNVAKAKLNSLYGMCVTRCLQPEIMEDYDYDPLSMEPVYKEKELEDPKAEYEKYVKKRKTVLPYSWGVWCTSYARRNLILGLGSCVDDIYKEDGTRKYISHWLYSDTDSIFSDSWNEHRVEMYNLMCKQKIQDAGYGPVVVDGKEFWLGIASPDKTATEFKTQGAKRYCYRDINGKLNITISGVPKEGVKTLEDDINKFKPTTVFKGEDSGKKAHFYFYSKDIHIDEDGNEIGDSIDLHPCDYELDSTEKWEYIEEEDVIIQVFDEEDMLK